MPVRNGEEHDEHEKVRPTEKPCNKKQNKGYCDITCKIRRLKWRWAGHMHITRAELLLSGILEKARGKEADRRKEQSGSRKMLVENVGGRLCRLAIRSTENM
ncbi:hypothetical protein KGM_209106 [Danaus plexippus plexippus]|uniref:Uncharacterized protein n=1 Tax=Danaus plexippus plexippus TaxID=278856 RepID=A0A212EUS5_DANPL|nr:hypothetical protein KGM_209107 [Danaus plexippus plexippus]OWR45242.1 hypothetical protein KGM_209106 [Danaus plexippus plexippus]